MSEKEKNEPHRIDRGLVHPAITLAQHMAHGLYAARTAEITAAEFQELFHSTATSADWRDYGITMRTAALMVATALHLQAALGPTAALSPGTSPSDPAAAEAIMHAQRTMEAVSALSVLANQFGGGSPRP